MKKFEHEALKMFGKLADLKAEHDRTDIGLAPLAGQHMRVHDDMIDLLPCYERVRIMEGFSAMVDQQHVLLSHMPVIREYVKHRTDGVPALTSWRWANSTVTQRDDLPEGFNTNGRFFEVDGFDIMINIEPDDSLDYSHLGEFVDSDRDGAIKNPEAWTSSGNRNHSFMPYFVPTYSEDQHYAELQKYGMDKQSAHLEARKYVMADLEQAKDYSSYIAIVKAFKSGIELGYDVLGGIDYDDPAEAIFDHGMIDTAVEEAKKALAKLIESVK